MIPSLESLFVVIGVLDKYLLYMNLNKTIRSSIWTTQDVELHLVVEYLGGGEGVVLTGGGGREVGGRLAHVITSHTHGGPLQSHSCNRKWN